jgi:UDP-N-acetylglucosamine 4,6-dehydratase
MVASPGKNITEYFRDKNILITGGTGSFGRAFAKRLLTDNVCNKVVIFSRDEWKQWDMQQTDPIFSHPKIRYFLGDVRDSERLRRAFNEIHYVVHAAALKQVPAAEYNPAEFIKTNIIGGMNVIDASLDCGVERVIALSTDKAVNPINLYGATKLCSDKLFCAGHSYVGLRGYPRFSVVRYGNVLGSRGSIIPLWRKMLDEGCKELPLTDIRMTRFWITLDQAVDFVLESFSHMRGSEIFVPKIPSMKISDLAEVMAPGIPHKILGIREGEKLHELMVSNEDARHTLEFDKFYMIIPEMYSRDPQLLAHFLDGREGKALPEGFAYCSGTNEKWINAEQMKKLVTNLLH